MQGEDSAMILDCNEQHRKGRNIKISRGGKRRKIIE
jgi:hypothetical protein